ncbi:MAG: hydrolase [Gemmataceae bacterium]
MHATRMSHTDTGLLVIDMQEKLLPIVPGRSDLLEQITFLVEVALKLGLTVQATEQYPKGLGSTVAPLGDLIPQRPAKTGFSCCDAPGIVDTFHREARPKIVLCGIETHVCVLNTALDLLAHNFRVYVAVDAVGSRFAHDHQVALRRMEQAGVIPTTVETCVFEWMGGASHPNFKEISRLVQGRMKAMGGLPS